MKTTHQGIVRLVMGLPLAVALFATGSATSTAFAQDAVQEDAKEAPKSPTPRLRARTLSLRALQTAAGQAEQAAQPAEAKKVEATEKPADKKDADKKEVDKKEADKNKEKDTAAEEAPKAPPTDPEALRIHLMDGSQISGKLASKEIVVETQFGNLTVPVLSIHSFTPGLRSHPKVEQNISELIEKLGSPVFGERENAQKALSQMGPVVRLQLERAANDADTERKSRIKTLLEEIDQGEEDAAEGGEGAVRALIDRDTVETTDFTVVGKIAQETFDIVSRYGGLSVKLSDIKRVERENNAKEDLKKVVTVEGAHIIHRGMKDSGIRLEKGDKVTVTADGSIQMTPWGNQAVSSPEGMANYGWYVQGKIAGGALVGKVGSGGSIFKIGSKYSFTADRAGTLQLAVAMQNDFANQQFPGEYKVRVNVKRK